MTQYDKRAVWSLVPLEQNVAKQKVEGGHRGCDQHDRKPDYEKVLERYSDAFVLCNAWTDHIGWCPN